VRTVVVANTVEKAASTAIIAEKPAETVVATIAIAPTSTKKAAGAALPTSARSASPTSPDAVINHATVNLREGPGEDYAITKSYPQGTALRVLGQVPRGEWLKVRTPDGAIGWMYASYLRVNLKIIPLAEAPSTPALQGLQKEIVLSGTLEALKRGDQFVWASVAVECYDASGRSLGRVALDREGGRYQLPSDTSKVKLWIGEELGGAGWWGRWDSQSVTAAPARVVLEIRPLGSGGPPAAVTEPPYPWPTPS